jgi:toxin-antitoxin system PIN domain toxin
VILVDTNLLVYATFEDAPEHGVARTWLGEQLREAEGSVALCWPVIYAFLRLITSPHVFGRRAIRVRNAWEVADAYLEQPAARIVVPGNGHAAIAGELAATPGLRSEDVPDIEISALAIEHGLVLASHDHGFRRFSRLRFVDPLVEPAATAASGLSARGSS